MDNEHAVKTGDVKPQLGANGHFCMELFCGSGNLTYAMKHFFPDSFGVDHKVGKQRVKVICLDLTREDHQELIYQWATSGTCLWVHFGIPCGTASRARFKRLSKKIHGPPPLRSSRWPDGLPNVSGTNLLRLRAANRLYAFMSKLILKLDAAGITWTVENPWSSLLWETSYWQTIDEKLRPFYCELHNCMFGGQRLKKTCIASNRKSVMGLNILCSGDHDRAPWSIQDGIFDTAREAEYTPALAKALATVILESIAGEYKLTNVVQHAKKLKVSHFQAIAAGRQPTKSLVMQTVPEFSHVIILSHVPAEFSFDISDNVLRRCTSLRCDNHQFLVPCNSRLLRKTLKKGGESRLFKFVVEETPSIESLSDIPLEQAASRLQYKLPSCNNGNGKCETFFLDLQTACTGQDCHDWVFGVRWSAEDFLQQALTVGHPFKNFSGLPEEVRRACEYVAGASHEQVVNMRCRKLGEWMRLIREFSSNEVELKSKMPPCRRRILESKRLEFMRHVIKTEGYEDASLADDIEKGFDLVGDAPKSFVLPSKVVPASISKHDLGRHAERANVALRYMTRSCGDSSLDAQLWERTMHEVDKGWLVGPLCWEELPSSSSVSRRFPLPQSGKVRPIDDLSQSQINATVSTYEQATVDGPDVICSLAVYLMKCLSTNGNSTKLVGRSLDLASAYRQLAISDESLSHSYLSVFDPVESKAALFQQIALPFGSRTAVNAFIRCARFLQWVAAKCLSLPLSCYFDDFVAFSTTSLGQNTQATLCLMLDIFGWRFDKEGPKSDDFSELVSALGVQFNLSDTPAGILHVCNTEKRIKDIIQLLDETLETGILPKKDALSLRGRLAFCDAFVFGRLGKVSLQDITKHAYAKPFIAELSDRLVGALKLLKDRFLTGGPRSLSCKMLDTYFLFTDASFNMSTGAGFGAVLVSNAGEIVSWFGLVVDTRSLALFLDGGRQNIIGELETLTVAMSLLLWGDIVSSSQLMIYIDNEGAKFSLIRGYSDSLAITSICALTATALDKFFILPWFSRVPSSSNLADFPSRDVPHRFLRNSSRVPKAEVTKIFEESLEFVGQAG